MNYDDLYNESELAWNKRARTYAREVIDPQRAKIDEGGMCRELIRELGKQKLLGTVIPKEYGGEGLDCVHNSVISSELAMCSPSLAAMRAVGVIFAAIPIIRYGTKEQKEAFLRPMVDGTQSYSLAITEPGAGSDAASMSLRAKADGDGFVIDGVKHYISGSFENDAALVYAATDPDAAPRHKFSAFLVPLKKTKGIKIEPIPTTGLRGFSHSRIDFEHAKIDKSCLIGEVGQGFEVMLYGLEPERVDIASRGFGCASRALEEAVKYAAERVQFGKPIRSFQGVSHKIADMRAMVEAMRLLVHRAARLTDKGVNAEQATSIAKLVACERGFAICDDAMQILGARGYTAGSAVDVMFRDIRALRFGGGTDEIMRHVIQREEFAPFRA